MKKIWLFSLLLAFSQMSYAQKKDNPLAEESIYGVLEQLEKAKAEYKSEKAGQLFEEASKIDTFIKEKELWDFFIKQGGNGNFSEKIDIKRVAKIIGKDYNQLFVDWYGEQATLDLIEYNLNMELWAFNDNADAVDKFLKPLLKDEVQLIYISEKYLVSYNHEMSGQHIPSSFDPKKYLETGINAAKDNDDKAKIYKDAARLAYLFDNNLLQAIDWAQLSYKIKADKDIYYLLSDIYGKLARQK